MTNLPEGQTQQVVDVYRRRWSVERLVKELAGAAGLDQHQVSKGAQHVARSVAISAVAYRMDNCEVPCPRHPGARLLEPVYAQTELRMAGRLKTDRTFC